MDERLNQAVQAGSVDRVRALLDGGLGIDSKDQYGQTPLMNAAIKGDAALVRLLTERGATLDVTAKYGLSALMLAIIRGHEQVAEVLIHAGADLTIRGRGALEFDGRTALDLAEERELTRIVTLLRGHAAPSDSPAESA